MLWKSCIQYASKFGKHIIGHKTGKRQFSFQSQRKAMPMNAQTTTQLHSSHMLAWRRQWHPTPVLLPGKFHGQRSLACYSPWVRKESDVTVWLSTHTHIYTHLHVKLSHFGVVMEFQLSCFKSWKMMLWKSCSQYASKFGKLSSGHRTGKGQFSFQSQRKAMPKNSQTTAQLCSSHMLVK